MTTLTARRTRILASLFGRGFTLQIYDRQIELTGRRLSTNQNAGTMNFMIFISLVCIFGHAVKHGLDSFVKPGLDSGQYNL